MDNNLLKNIIEALLLSTNEPLTAERLLETFDEWQRPSKEHLETLINELKEEYSSRSFELIHVATGFSIQTKKNTVLGSHAYKLKSQLSIHVLCLKH